MTRKYILGIVIFLIAILMSPIIAIVTGLLYIVFGVGLFVFFKFCATNLDAKEVC